jgi:hypothetical protein
MGHFEAENALYIKGKLRSPKLVFFVTADVTAKKAQISKVFSEATKQKSKVFLEAEKQNWKKQFCV